MRLMHGSNSSHTRSVVYMYTSRLSTHSIEPQEEGETALLPFAWNGSCQRAPTTPTDASVTHVAPAAKNVSIAVAAWLGILALRACEPPIRHRQSKEEEDESAAHL